MNHTIDSYGATFPLLKTPAQAVKAVQAAEADTVVILDFDETLFLRNSTQAYLDAVYPRPLGAAFLVAAKAVRPWRFFPQQFRETGIARDWFLVVAVTLLFPWTLLVWQRRAKRLAETYYNQPLLQALIANPQAKLVVATLGFDWIVKPLIQHLPADLRQRETCEVVACRFWQGVSDRARGKLAMVIAAIGERAVSQAVAVTDAIVDKPLLEAVAQPYLLSWAEAEYIPAMADVYVPLFYSEKVKNPNVSHIVKRVLLGHWAFVTIALSFLSPHPVLNAASWLVLIFSYWCVYEVGYQENDLIGEKYENKPILSEAYAAYKARINLTKTIAPWYAAMGLAVPGLLLLEVSQRHAEIGTSLTSVSQLWPDLLRDGGIWLALLLTVRLTFWLYNRFNEETRIWAYPVLQIQTLLGCTLLAGTNAVGTLLLLSLVVCRWLYYSIYRCGGDRWKFPINLSCLVLFTIMFGATAIGAADPLSLLTWQTAAAFAYCTSRAYKGWVKLKPRLGVLTQVSAEVVASADAVLVPPISS